MLHNVDEFLAVLQNKTLDNTQLLGIKNFIAKNKDNLDVLNTATKDNNYTALYLAAAYGHIEVVKILITIPGININSLSKSGWCALTIAHDHKYSKIISVLLDTPGINDTPVDLDGNNALCWAVAKGYIDTVNTILAIPGSNVKAVNKHGNGALNLAAHYGHTAIVNALLNEGAELNERGGNHALLFAIYNNQPETVKALLAIRGIHVNTANIHCETPLIVATVFGFTDMVNALLATQGIEVNTVDKNGNSPLNLAIINNHKAIVKALLAFDGIHIKTANSLGYTPLISAARNGLEAIVNDLLKMLNIDDVNAVNKNGDGALHWAVANNHSNIVTTLLAIRGIHVNTGNILGDTPLIVAANKGHTRIVNTLLAILGIEVNAINKDGNSALMDAIEKGHTDVIKVLLAAPGVNVNIVNKKGLTALTMPSNDATRSALLNYYAKWLLTAKKEDVTTQILDLLKPHKEELYQQLIMLHDKFEIMKTIVNEKDATAIVKVFWYKNSTLKKGRLGKIYQEYLDYIKKNADTGKLDEIIVIDKDNDKDIEIEKEKDQPNNLSIAISTAVASSDFKTVVALLFSNKDKSELTTATLDLLKSLKENLFKQVQTLNPADELQAVKQIFEGKNTTALGTVLWYKNSTLSSGRLATFYQTYKLMIETELFTLKDKDLTPANIQFINEFINSESAFKLDDQLVNTLLWKWLNQTNVTQLTTSGRSYLKQYKEKFLAMDKPSASSIALKQLLVEEKLPPLVPWLFNRFKSSVTEVFTPAATKETAAQYKEKL